MDQKYATTTKNLAGHGSTRNHTIQEAESGRSRVPDQPGLHSDSQTSLGYTDKPYFKKKDQKVSNQN